MKKQKINNRALSFFIVLFFTIMIIPKAFAVENNTIFKNIDLKCYSISTCETNSSSKRVLKDNTNISMKFNNNVSVLSNDVVRGTVPVGGSITLNVHLDSYIGLKKNFYVSTVSASETGGLLLYLYNPKGKLVSNDWMMGANEMVQWSITLPSSGDWKLKAVAFAVDEPVSVAARWE